MRELVNLPPLDYLAVGHVAVDLTPAGEQLGGTVAYAALTAHALGLRAGIVTSHGPLPPLQALDGISIVSVPSTFSTTYENRNTAQGREQILHRQAGHLSLEDIPTVWRETPIIHLAPIAQELDPQMPARLSPSFLGITPQGWLRTWDENGRVSACDWKDSDPSLQLAGAVVVSQDDVRHNLEQVEWMAHQTRVLCLTEGRAGAVMHWHGDRRRFRPPEVVEVDSTCAWDIFAAALFVRLSATHDPWEAARFATQLAARSVTRIGLNGIPTRTEIDRCLMEVLS